MKNYVIPKLCLTMFDEATNTTVSEGLSAEMKTYYSDYLIDNATPNLVHAQFGQRRPIPKNGGKSVEFRKYAPLPKATVPLKEGTPPKGTPLNVSTVTAKIHQYGDFVPLSDMVILTAIDNNMVEAVKLLGDQAGRTVDTIVREAINGGTNVIYANGNTARADLTEEDLLTVLDVRKAVRELDLQNAKRINGYYVGIIHPDAAFDLQSDPEWRKPKEYADPEDLYTGELGEIAGVRFVKSTEAKIFKGEALPVSLKVKAFDENTRKITVEPEMTEDIARQMINRFVTVGGVMYRIEDAGTDYITVDCSTEASAPLGGADILAGGGGADNRAVYSTLILGENAYGIIDIEGGGMQHIVKQLGSGGTADPLDQKATAGWKATQAAKILVDQFIVRIESCSTYDSEAN